MPKLSGEALHEVSSPLAIRDVRTHCTALFIVFALSGAAAADEPIRVGDRGDSVRILQQFLNDARRAQNSKEIQIDGAFGAKTTSTLSWFQRAAGLPPTGVFKRRTWRKLKKVVAKTPLGRIDPFVAPLAEDAYALKKGKPKDVRLRLLPEIETRAGVRARPIFYAAKLAVDADGDGDAWKGDPWGQASTSFQYRGGRSLNPTTMPYFVLPIGLDKIHTGIRLGDVAAVIYRGKVAYAIYGDRGPRGQIGEGSIKLAEDLGINSSPTHGGVGAGVITIVFPGSGERRPLELAELRRRGEKLLAKAGGAPHQGPLRAKALR